MYRVTQTFKGPALQLWTPAAGARAGAGAQDLFIIKDNFICHKICQKPT